MNFTIKQFSESCGLCRTTIYKLINEGRLRTIKIGARRLIIESPQEFFDREHAMQNPSELEACHDDI